MSDVTSFTGSPLQSQTGAGHTVSFAAWFANSTQFDSVYKEGMALVERTASYLDGPGRKEAKGLQPPLTLTYATESMRLTTRLLELASWLMLHRALKDGEIDQQQADLRRQRVKLAPLGRPAHVKGFDELPEGLRELVQHSFTLNDRIQKLDQALSSQSAAPEPRSNVVIAQVARLEAAFGGLRRAG